ncbi:methyltransferase domain-containing protein [Pluralibacter gergoviae]|uniref:class I SAM-dependent methyltransferase n=1 Tax=Pluralibacter gergoviae TaxID=61647 RepID=UPI003EE00E0E
MTKELNTLVSELPEIYQTIFGHPEWDGDAARDCNQRLGLITEQYDKLSSALGRPLRVLDLGCAQGFFSLSLASRGATIVGIDFQQENIDVCRALAEENPEFKTDFQVGRVEEVIASLEDGEFDLAIGLSVFHHIVHLYGIDEVKRLLSRLADVTQAVILELAVKEEPLYWANSQPDDPRELIEQCAFYRLIGQFDTHLSPVPRPMYIISNHRVLLNEFNQTFQHWQNRPYASAGLAHKLSRRYFFGENYVCKFFYYSMPDNSLTPEESLRNQNELKNEVEFLSHPPKGFTPPALLSQGENAQSGWLVMEKISGRLLSDMLAAGEVIDRDKVIDDILNALSKLEKQGFWHDDIRTWNIMVDKQNNARLIDFGSIVNAPKDCSWPQNIVQSFFVFVNELFSENNNLNGFWRSAPIHPFNLPTPWCNWLYAVWQKPVETWSFTLLLELFKKKSKLPSSEQQRGAVDEWIIAQEPVLLELQTRLRHHSENAVDVIEPLNALKKELFKLQQAHEELVSKYDVLAVGQQDIIERQLEPAAVLEPESKLSAGLLWLTNNMERLNLLLHSADSKIESAVQPELQPDVAELQRRLENASREINHLSNENQHLRSEIDKIHRSRSWRMTKGYRYLGLQIHLLRQYGFSQRCKHFIKRILRIVFSFLRKHPKIKHAAVNSLHKFGLYQPAYRLYRRMNPLPHSQYQVDSQVLSQTEMQVMHPELLPPEVHEIYLKLTKNK